MAAILRDPQRFNGKRIGFTDQLQSLASLRETFTAVTGRQTTFQELPPPKSPAQDGPKTPDITDIMQWHRQGLHLRCTRLPAAAQ